MKKLLLLFVLLTLGVALTGCKDDDTELVCTALETLVDGECVAITVDPDPDPDPDPVEDYFSLDGVYTTYFSGIDNMNPYSNTMADASTMYTFLTNGLYYGDYDWATAIEDGLATEVGDFETSGAAALPYTRLPGMALEDPVDMTGDGTVWQITLREDLEFEDGTAIDANTFDYSWSMLLDPLLLNDRSSNLYDTSNLPIVNAEGYFKQKTPDQDELGFDTYFVDPVTYARYNSFSHLVTGTTWELFYVESGMYEGITFAAGATALEQDVYTEYWGDGYGPNGYVMVDYDDAAFEMDEDGVLIAPYLGWTYADGSAVATAADAVGDTDYFGVYPAYYSDEVVPTRAVVDAEGIPVGGVVTYNDATVVLWSEVGFEVISQYVFQITLEEGKTGWDVKGNLMGGTTGVVHEASFEAGMNDGRTQTDYGTIDNPLVSYGNYNLTTWEDDVVFIFTRNDNYHDAADYRIKTIRYEVIEDQSIAVDEFKLGNLDVVGVSGDYYEDFKFSPYLKLSPATTFFRFAFNIAGSEQYDLNPILVYPEFREAFYYAIDREEFSLEVRAPSHPTFGFLGPVYLTTEYNSIAYRNSEAGAALLADYYPETYGFNPVEARILFDEAYALAVAEALLDDDSGNANTFVDGDKVTVEYKFYDVETNWKVANWVKSTVESIFNDVTSSPRFELVLAAVSGAALNDAWDNGDFEMTFGGWQGLDFNAPSMLGQVYNSDLAYMLEVGFDTAGAEVVVSLPQTHAALTTWMADYLLMTETTDTQDEEYDAWVALEALFVGDVLTTTYNELYEYAYSELYNVADVNYEGKTTEFDVITAALEGVLLDQMISIPLFTTVASTVYSARVVFEANEYHAWMVWGGYRYMYLQPE